MPISRPRVLASLVFAVLAQSGFAHEFWLEPERYRLDPNEVLIAQFKNGENFEGINLGFFDRRSARFEWQVSGQTQSLTPRAGSVPALEHATKQDGLHVVAHETVPSSITYNDWAKFQAFADHKDFPDIRRRHQDRGLPETGFSERYTRHAKTLVAVGTGQGADQAMGLETEFVALANPYTDDLSDGLPVQLFYRAQPRADAQIEIFDRAPDGAVTVTLTRTDAAGRAIIPVQRGHAYLLDAVVLRAGSEGADDVWETLWASLTFQRP